MAVLAYHIHNQMTGGWACYRADWNYSEEGTGLWISTKPVKTHDNRLAACGCAPEKGATSFYGCSRKSV